MFGISDPNAFILADLQKKKKRVLLRDDVGDAAVDADLVAAVDGLRLSEACYDMLRNLSKAQQAATRRRSGPWTFRRSATRVHPPQPGLERGVAAATPGERRPRAEPADCKTRRLRTMFLGGLRWDEGTGPTSDAELEGDIRSLLGRAGHGAGLVGLYVQRALQLAYAEFDDGATMRAALEACEGSKLRGCDVRWDVAKAIPSFMLAEPAPAVTPGGDDDAPASKRQLKREKLKSERRAAPPAGGDDALGRTVFVRGLPDIKAGEAAVRSWMAGCGAIASVELGHLVGQRRGRTATVVFETLAGAEAACDTLNGEYFSRSSNKITAGRADAGAELADEVLELVDESPSGTILCANLPQHYKEKFGKLLDLKARGGAKTVLSRLPGVRFEGTFDARLARTPAGTEVSRPCLPAGAAVSRTAAVAPPPKASPSKAELKRRRVRGAEGLDDGCRAALERYAVADADRCARFLRAAPSNLGDARDRARSSWTPSAARRHARRCELAALAPELRDVADELALTSEVVATLAGLAPEDQTLVALALQSADLARVKNLTGFVLMGLKKGTLLRKGQKREAVRRSNGAPSAVAHAAKGDWQAAIAESGRAHETWESHLRSRAASGAAMDSPMASVDAAVESSLRSLEGTNVSAKEWTPPARAAADSAAAVPPVGTNVAAKEWTPSAATAAAVPPAHPWERVPGGDVNRIFGVVESFQADSGYLRRARHPAANSRDYDVHFRSRDAPQFEGLQVGTEVEFTLVDYYGTASATDGSCDKGLACPFSHGAAAPGAELAPRASPSSIGGQGPDAAGAAPPPRGGRPAKKKPDPTVCTASPEQLDGLATEVLRLVDAAPSGTVLCANLPRLYYLKYRKALDLKAYGASKMSALVSKLPGVHFGGTHRAEVSRRGTGLGVGDDAIDASALAIREETQARVRAHRAERDAAASGALRYFDRARPRAGRWAAGCREVVVLMPGSRRADRPPGLPHDSVALLKQPGAWPGSFLLRGVKAFAGALKLDGRCRKTLEAYAVRDADACVRFLRAAPGDLGDHVNESVPLKDRSKSSARPSYTTTYSRRPRELNALAPELRSVADALALTSNVAKALKKLSLAQQRRAAERLADPGVMFGVLLRNAFVLAELKKKERGCLLRDDLGNGRVDEDLVAALDGFRLSKDCYRSLRDRSRKKQALCALALESMDLSKITDLSGFIEKGLNKGTLLRKGQELMGTSTPAMASLVSAAAARAGIRREALPAPRDEDDVPEEFLLDADRGPPPARARAGAGAAAAGAGAAARAGPDPDLLSRVALPRRSAAPRGSGRRGAAAAPPKAPASGRKAAVRDATVCAASPEQLSARRVLGLCDAAPSGAILCANLPRLYYLKYRKPFDLKAYGAAKMAAVVSRLPGVHYAGTHRAEVSRKGTGLGDGDDTIDASALAIREKTQARVRAHRDALWPQPGVGAAATREAQTEAFETATRAAGRLEPMLQRLVEACGLDVGAWADLVVEPWDAQRALFNSCGRRTTTAPCRSSTRAGGDAPPDLRRARSRAPRPPPGF
ncbi:ubiquitin-protein transferase [Aureococcus anophagefferens]|nr:ubiquitin-protein transferase [Aureococcus anophagefferens]